MHRQNRCSKKQQGLGMVLVSGVVYGLQPLMVA